MAEKREHQCVIGLLYNYDSTRLLTLEELVALVRERKEMDEFAAKDPVYSRMPKLSTYTLRDYCDLRKSTDLRRFKYCPECGDKIDWKALRTKA